jgi:4'-phosphopantetheinyl transferase EntD
MALSDAGSPPAASGDAKSPIVRALFSPAVVTREGAIATGALDALLPEERASIARAVSSRQSDFAAGRWLARSALETFGVRGFALVNDGAGAPRWPSGMVGTITHTRRAEGGFAAVAVASTRSVRALGIDAESDQALKEDLWDVTLCEEEREALSRAAAAERVRLASLMFSAKECYYKHQYTLTRTFLEFSAATVRVATRGDAFSIVVRQSVGDQFREGDVLGGRFVLHDGIVVTAMELAA